MGNRLLGKRQNGIALAIIFLGSSLINVANNDFEIWFHFDVPKKCALC